MPAAVHARLARPPARAHLPALVTAGLLAEFWAELALLVPPDTPYRGLAALLLAAIAVAVVAGRRAPLIGALVVFGATAALPALSHVYYDELVLPFAAPFVAAYWLGAHAGRRALAIGLALGAALTLAATAPYDDATR